LWANKNVRTIGYLRVSTVDQDLEKNKHEILDLANNKDFGKVEWVEEKVSGRKFWKDRKIKEVIDILDSGDRIIVPELSRLGRSMLEIMEMLSVLNQKEVSHLFSQGRLGVRWKSSI
jgi:DNA invertase Pin-like site-specific DNA recombinase